MLKHGAFYRLNYSGWITTPMPIAFVLYAGAASNKAHVLYINAPGTPKSEFVKFISIIKHLTTATPNAMKNPRSMYNVLKKYCPQFMKTSYRTLWKSKIINHAIVSYGFARPEDFSEVERLQNQFPLYQQANRMYQTVVVNNLIPNKKIGQDFYKPSLNNQKKIEDFNKKKELEKEKITQQNQVNIEQKKTSDVKKPNQTYSEPRSPGDDVQGY